MLASLADLDNFDDPDDISEITEASVNLQEAKTLRTGNHYDDNGTIDTNVFRRGEKSKNSSDSENSGNTLDANLSQMIADPEIERKLILMLTYKMRKKTRKKRKEKESYKLSQDEAEEHNASEGEQDGLQRKADYDSEATQRTNNTNTSDAEQKNTDTSEGSSAKN